MEGKSRGRNPYNYKHVALLTDPNYLLKMLQNYYFILEVTYGDEQGEGEYHGASSNVNVEKKGQCYYSLQGMNLWPLYHLRHTPYS